MNYLLTKNGGFCYYRVRMKTGQLRTVGGEYAMQNRYACDIGDFGKFGLLRALSAAGLSVGLQWYLVPDETHNEDGRHIAYLAQPKFKACDEGLWLALNRIVAEKRRGVSALEEAGIIRANYYSKPLSFTGKSATERIESRNQWHREALTGLRGTDVVFVDPDNGLMTPSAAGTPRSNKYVEPRELEDYYLQGASVVYYQHKARVKDDFYLEQHRELLSRSGFKGATGMCLKFVPTSQRYYFFIIQPKHESIILECVDRFLATPWRMCFCQLKLSASRANDSVFQRTNPLSVERLSAAQSNQEVFPMNEVKKAVISVLGTDKKGIIAQVSRILYENDANIMDISQTIVSGLFSMILIADISSPACAFDTLKTELDALGGRIGVQIRIQRSEIFEAMYQI